MTEDERIEPEFEAMAAKELDGRSVLPVVDVPKRVDEAVLAIAETRCAQIRAWRERRRRRAIGFAVGAAALLLVVARFTLWPGSARHVEIPAGEERQIAEKPDIVDAYMLARKLVEGGETSDEDDANLDGRVDATDVETLAKRAVSVLGTGRG